MVSLTFDKDIKAMQKLFHDLPSVVNKAAATTITSVIYDGRDKVKEEMSKVFQSPTPYTLNSLKVIAARSNNLVGELRVKNQGDAGKGTAADKYLAPEVFGHERNLKRFEKALRAARILPSNMFAVPASGAQFDQYGNMSRGQIVQILSYFQAFGEQGYRANAKQKRINSLKRGTKSSYGFVYFIGGPATKLKPGIYKRTILGHGHAIKPVILFVKQPKYTMRLNWGKITVETANNNFKKKFHDNMIKSLMAKGYK